MSEGRSARRHRFDWSEVRPFAAAKFHTRAFVALWKCAGGVEGFIDFKRVFQKKKKQIIRPANSLPVRKDLQATSARIVTYWQSVQSAEAAFALQKEKL